MPGLPKAMDAVHGLLVYIWIEIRLKEHNGIRDLRHFVKLPNHLKEPQRTGNRDPERTPHDKPPLPEFNVGGGPFPAWLIRPALKPGVCSFSFPVGVGAPDNNMA